MSYNKSIWLDQIWGEKTLLLMSPVPQLIVAKEVDWQKNSIAAHYSLGKIRHSEKLKKMLIKNVQHFDSTIP